MPYYYNIADIFATASKSETQGLTLIEAMAADVSVVCMRDEAFLSMVTEDLNALIFENQKEYQEKVLYLYENEKEHKKMNHQARIAAEQYSATIYGTKVLDVYKRAIKEKQEENRFGIFSRIIKRIKGE